MMYALLRIDMNARSDNEILEPTTIYILQQIARILCHGMQKHKPFRLNNFAWWEKVNACYGFPMHRMH